MIAAQDKVLSVDKIHGSSTRAVSRRTDDIHARHSGYYYTWAERHEIFKAAFNVSLDEAGEFPFAYFLGLLMLAGMRPEEALLTRWEAPRNRGENWPWPDMTLWQIVIPQGPSVASNRRLIPIIPQLARQLTYWPLPKKGLLFPFHVTGPQILACWNDTLKLSNARHVSISALRHTYSMMMQDVFGLTPAAVARILGEPRAAVSTLHPPVHRSAPRPMA